MWYVIHGWELASCCCNAFVPWQGMHTSVQQTWLLCVLYFVTFPFTHSQSLSFSCSFSLSVPLCVHICISICFIRSFKAALHLQLLQIRLHTFQRTRESRWVRFVWQGLLLCMCVCVCVCVLVQEIAAALGFSFAYCQAYFGDLFIGRHYAQWQMANKAQDFICDICKRYLQYKHGMYV